MLITQFAEINKHTHMINDSPEGEKRQPVPCVYYAKKDRTNQVMTWCPCGAYYYFETERDMPLWTDLRCPYCGSNDHGRIRQHSGGYYNSGSF